MALRDDWGMLGSMGGWGMGGNGHFIDAHRVLIMVFIQPQPKMVDPSESRHIYARKYLIVKE